MCFSRNYKKTYIEGVIHEIVSFNFYFIFDKYIMMLLYGYQVISWREKNSKMFQDNTLYFAIVLISVPIFNSFLVFFVHKTRTKSLIHSTTCDWVVYYITSENKNTAIAVLYEIFKAEGFGYFARKI